MTDAQATVTELPTRDPASIHVLMGRVLADLPAIGKEDQAPDAMGGYKFRGIESITAALKPLLGEHGVFVVPETLERLEGERRVGSSNNPRSMYVVDVHVRWTFHGPASDSLSCSTWGQGTDMGDKATQKAYTSAFKSMLAVAFCIADSETDAERHDVPETGPQIEWAKPDLLKALYDRAAGLSEAGKKLLRERWEASPSLADYRPGNSIPAESVPLVASFLEAAEAQDRAVGGSEGPEGPQGPPGGSGSADPARNEPPSPGDPPVPQAASGVPAEEKGGGLEGVGIPAEEVRRITEEVAAMTQQEVDDTLKLWRRPITGRKEVRRQRLVEAMVRDRVAHPASDTATP